jgi:hypothetical protein
VDAAAFLGEVKVPVVWENAFQMSYARLKTMACTGPGAMVGIRVNVAVGPVQTIVLTRQLPLVERALDEVELTDHLGGSSSSAAFRERCWRAEELTEEVEAAIEASAAA